MMFDNLKGISLLESAGGVSISQDASTAFSLARVSLNVPDEQAFLALADKAAEPRVEGQPRVDSLDRLLGVDPKALRAKAVDAIEVFRAKWRGEVAALTRALDDWTPSGWMAHLQDPKFLENTALIKELLSNPNYARLHAGSAALGVALQRLRDIQKDGCGMVLPVEAMTSAASVHKNAVDTVLYSYVLLMITQTIPANPAPAARKKAVKALKDELGPRLERLCETVQGRVAELSEGKEFAAVDYAKV
ncbi:unnamed protein product [Prorocentrum cordatum]|uniref:Uncharacterized protein n=1 Tax=Prorocentrum cordatum TaxID=2364126 RepID=A0ABN9PVD7_9DINO|nr:unnamed protein product [Polarella glacialis]